MRKSSLVRFLVFAALVLTSARALAASGDYWQQYVHYTIDATLIDSIHTLDGTVRVTYTNHSPDTLREVYFHLYSNAFQHGSMMEERAKAEDSWLQYRFAKLGPSDEGRYTITRVSVDDRPATFEINGTIMKVALGAPLVPGASITIDVPFVEQIPKQTRRNGWMSDQLVRYSMAQWYPKIAEYDREGWQAQEYISHEFYGVWGDFDVTLHVPANFTVASSGECQNPDEAGHGYEKIAHGQKEGREEPHYGAEGLTTWKFHASTVHDFAWVADEYIHEWTTWNDTVTIHTVYKPYAESGWKEALANSKFALQTYSEAYGWYPYRNFSCTMAGDGGMEYPQLIMCTNAGAGLIGHETAHQWFYGLLGSNETREAFMDEGFTQYVTSVAMEKLYGRNMLGSSSRSWLDWFVPMFDSKRDNYHSYQTLARSGYEEPLVIPHDWAREGVNAVQVYTKTLAVLNMLQYTLGDDVFAAAMKAYYADWHFKHPHLIDFQRVMERVSGADLDWFFDEWFRSTRTIGYAAVGVDSRGVGDKFETTVRLRNDELGVMPIDLLLHYSDGSSEAATIPLSVNKGAAYHKSGTSIFFPGWDWPAKSYTGTTITPKPVSWFEIDTSWRLQDLDWLNNFSPRAGLPMPRGYWRVWQNLAANPPLDGYYAVARPIVWYSKANGFEAGAGLRYGMLDAFSGDLKLVYKARPLARDSSLMTHFDGRFTYTTPVDWLGRLSTFSGRIEKIDGISTARVELKKIFRPEYLNYGATHSAGLVLEHQRLLEPEYPFYHHEWSHGSTRTASLWYFVSKNATNFGLSAEAGLSASDNSFSRAFARFETAIGLPYDLGLKVRSIVGTSTSATPIERRYWLGRENPHDEQESDFFRSMTNVSGRFDLNAHPYLDGGAGVRGVNTFDSTEPGKHMIGLSADVALPNPLASMWSPLGILSAGLFADAGWIGSSDADFFGHFSRELMTDAGVKFGVDLLSLFPTQLRGVAEEYSQIPTIAIVLPLYINHPADGSSPIGLRWALSLGSTF